MSNFNRRIKNLNHKTTEKEFIQLVDDLKLNKQDVDTKLLVDLLSERHPLYKDQNTIIVQSMKGYLISSLIILGTPTKALPYLLEELETSFQPYIVAASAMAIRGLKEPHPGISSFLIKSVYNIWKSDTNINYSSYRSPYLDEEKTTGIKEIFKTLIFLGEKSKYVLPELYHLENNVGNYLNNENKKLLIDCIEKLEALDDPEDDCCTIPTEIYGSADSKDTVNKEINLSEITLQDQNGIETSWDNFFKGKYTVLSFFYTRCHNPRKCIQTIYNLVDIQESIKGIPALSDIQTAAITYDPEYDKSEILKSYGNNRRFNFDENNKMFRISNGMEQFIEQLNIGVNYKGESVNVHRIEVYIINPEGKIEKSFLRFQAKENLIIDELKKITQSPKIKKQTFFNKLYTVTIPVIIAFFPKCPMCWASYMNLLGISGIISIQHQPWFIYLFIALALFNLINLYRLAKKRNGLLPFYFALLGTLVLAVNYFFTPPKIVLVIGIIFMTTSTLLNSLKFKVYHKLTHSLRNKFLNVKFKLS